MTPQMQKHEAGISSPQVTPERFLQIATFLFFAFPTVFLLFVLVCWQMGLEARGGLWIGLLTLCLFWWLIPGTLFLTVARPWMKALLHRIHTSVPAIVAMRFRRLPVGILIDATITLRQSGQDVSLAEVAQVCVENRSQVFSSADVVRLVRNDHEATSTLP